MTFWDIVGNTIMYGMFGILLLLVATFWITATMLAWMVFVDLLERIFRGHR